MRTPLMVKCGGCGNVQAEPDVWPWHASLSGVFRICPLCGRWGPRVELGATDQAKAQLSAVLRIAVVDPKYRGLLRTTLKKIEGGRGWN